MCQVDSLLIVGELVVDFTLPQNGAECKLRLGGIAHAARGLWASKLDYSVAAFCPKYLFEDARHYLREHGCKEFLWLGEIVGSPNVIVIGDSTEVSHQGYEDLLRDHKKINFHEPIPDNLKNYEKVIIFPGKFDASSLAKKFSPSARFVFDIAYDIDELSLLSDFVGRIAAIVISTSSALFLNLGNENVDDLISEINTLSPDVFLLKENRGGSRLFSLSNGDIENIPASLGKTTNSVGVGDVYSAVMLGFSDRGWIEAAWRGSLAATAYSQTTYPEDFQLDVQRSLALPLEVLQDLGGTVLPWHDRQRFSIYVAGPDFSYVQKPEFDRVVSCLNYHNFKIIRPVLQNGELKRPASHAELASTFHKDDDLLKTCDLVFAIPLDRDPGTLVEIGMALSLGKAVITYDPRTENNNTMVVGGSYVYSSDLDECLNGLFDALSKVRARIND